MIQFRNYPRGIALTLFAAIRNKHPVITNPVPMIVSLSSPNLLTKGPIRTPWTNIAIIPTTTKVKLAISGVHSNACFR